MLELFLIIIFFTIVSALVSRAKKNNSESIAVAILMLFIIIVFYNWLAGKMGWEQIDWTQLPKMLLGPLLGKLLP